jgi:hypothetical protein
LKDHVYKHDKIVIGSGVNALLYSYFNNLPVIFTDIRKPRFFERFGLDINFDELGFNSKTANIFTDNGIRTVGVPKNYIWGRLIYLLSYAGLMPLSDKAVSIRLQSRNILKVSTEYSRFVKFKFNELHVFADDNLHGISAQTDHLYEVLDWMNVRSGMNHEYDLINNSSDFVRHIYFYPSSRIDGAHDKKDLVAISYLTKDQLDDFNYSDTYARFAVEDLMKQSGIKGRRNGRDTNNPNIYRYYSIKVEAAKREVNSIKRFASPYKNIKIMDTTDEQLLKQFNTADNQYIQKLLKYFINASA